MADTRPSKKQRELLSFIDGFIKGNGYGPSYREVMRALDYKSVSTVAVHIDGLIKRGYLIKKDHSARSLEVVQEPARASSPAAVKPHEAWLVEQIEKKITAYKKSPDDDAKTNILTLLQTLRILELNEQALQLQERLENFSKNQ